MDVLDGDARTDVASGGTTGIVGGGGTTGVAGIVGGGGTTGVAGIVGGGGTTGAAGVSGGGGTAGTGEPVNRRWLALSDPRGTFAYDMRRFPAPEGLFMLSTVQSGGALPSWSPDGRLLLHGGPGGIHSTDMTGLVPGASILVTSYSGSSQISVPYESLAWSADSRSVAILLGSVLQTLNPRQAAATLHRLTFGPFIEFRWAPSGAKLLYLEVSGASVVDVDAGVPGMSLRIQDTLPPMDSVAWAPDGRRLAFPGVDGITLVDLTGPSPTRRVVASQYGNAPLFSPDGRWLAFSGSHDRPSPDTDVFVATVGSPGDPINIHPGLSSMHRAWSPSFSPTGSWLAYYVVDNTNSTRFYGVDLAGASPGGPIDTHINSPGPMQWVQGGKMTVFSGDHTTLHLFDFAAPTPASVPLISEPISRIFRFAFSGSRVAYDSDYRELKIKNVNAPDQTPTIVYYPADKLGSWEWSPDGMFVAATELLRNESYLSITRVEGLVASSPVPITRPTTALANFRWQP